MEKIILFGRKAVGGVAEGEALVTKDYISGWGGVAPNGDIIDVRHELYGKCIAGKVLVFRGAKGSSGYASAFQQTRLNGCAPAAMVYTVTNSKVALGCAVTRAPAVTDLNQDPTEVIETGDWVRVDADHGIVEVIKKG